MENFSLFVCNSLEKNDFMPYSAAKKSFQLHTPHMSKRIQYLKNRNVLTTFQCRIYFATILRYSRKGQGTALKEKALNSKFEIKVDLIDQEHRAMQFV